MTPTPITDLLESVVGAEAHSSRPTARAGGEWDAWRALPARQRRVLIGAGWARPGGMPPDVLADLICSRITTDEPLTWFYRTACASVLERRRAAQRDSRRRLAHRFDLPTYHAYRNTICTEAGYRSLWHYRKAMGWN